jgi:hypothetical protein
VNITQAETRGGSVVVPCKSVDNLRSSDLSLTRVRLSAFSFLILFCVSQHRWLNAIGQKKAYSQSLAITRNIHDGKLGEKISGQTCSVFEQKEPYRQNLSSTLQQAKRSFLRSKSVKIHAHPTSPANRRSYTNYNYP